MTNCLAKPYSHLLISQLDQRVSYTQQVIAKIIEDEPGFENHFLELEKIYSAVENEEIDLDTLSNTSYITETAKALDSRKDELSSWSETSKLWLNYQRMIKVVMKLIKADPTGSWQMHLDAILEAFIIFAAGDHSNYLKSSYLYLQKMKYLEKQNPKVFHKFMNGFHVTRRTNQYWDGLGSDLVIEQTHMRSLKSTGGLTRGSGMTAHQRGRWTMCALT